MMDIRSQNKQDMGKRIFGIVSLLVTFCCFTSQLVWSQQPRIAWEDLGTHIQAKHLSLEKLAGYDCSDEVKSEHGPARVVMQYIENTFYKWQEYEKDGLCIYMVLPEPGWLTHEKAQVLLSGSQLWRETIADLSEAQILDPNDVRLRMPTKETYIPEGETESLHRNMGGVERDDTPVSAPLPLPQPLQDDTGRTTRENGLQSESVLDQDDRQQVADTTRYPFNTIGFIGARFANGERFRGTGFLVGPHMMLTNGHMIYDPEQGGFVESLELAPGQDQPQPGGEVIRPFGCRDAEYVSTTQHYIDASSAGLDHSLYDYAAVFFTVPFEQISTFMPLEFNYEPTFINIAGYPGEAQGGASQTMWHSAGDVVSVDARVVRYLADSSGGNSGGPVWAHSSSTGLRRVVAVHAFGDTSSNGGPRLVSQNQNLIETWMQQTPPFGTPSNCGVR